MGTKGKDLVVRFDERRLAEYHVAVAILHDNGTSADVRDHAIDCINEALRRVSERDFESKVEEKLKEMADRSEAKKKERQKDSPNAQPTTLPNSKKDVA
jgi:hypothetical protein